MKSPLMFRPAEQALLRRGRSRPDRESHTVWPERPRMIPFSFFGSVEWTSTGKVEADGIVLLCAGDQVVLGHLGQPTDAVLRAPICSGVTTICTFFQTPPRAR